MPYNELPPLPPSVEVESKAVLKAAIEAHRALAELKGAGRNIPDQTVLLSALALQEAKLSSEIENIVTTNDELYRAFVDGPALSGDAATKEVMRYNRALWAGFEEIQRGRPIGTRLFERIVEIIKDTDLRVRRAGSTRIVNADTGMTIYTPPEGEDRLRAMLADLERFMHADDGLDPLVRLALAHYQFEAIHPFVDGNGRTGRIINILYLIERGLLELPVLYLSRYVVENKADYYARLRDVTESQAWESWILYMLDAIRSTASSTRKRIAAIRDLKEEVGARISREAPHVYSLDLLEVLFAQPYSKIGFVEDACRVTRQTASKYLQDLASLGLLERYKIGREAYYLNVPLLELLTAP
jgi:Fic family protein